MSDEKKENKGFLANNLQFAFEATQFNEVVAHEGIGLIFTNRVLHSREHSTINFIDLTVVPPGSEIGEHTHTNDNEEIYIIITGRGQMRVDGKVFDVSAGHTVVNRPGGTHYLKNTGDEDLSVVVVEVTMPSTSLC